jgi:hypothetical protein
MVGAWGPWEAWWYDLLKSAITFTIGAVITLFVIDRIYESREKQRKVEDAIFQLRLGALQEFRRSTANYGVAAQSAYTDLYQWHGKEKTGSMKWYEGTAYGEYLAAVAELHNRFPNRENIVDALAALDIAHKKRHGLYDKWVDSRLDHSPEALIDPGSDRLEFDALHAETLQLRGQIIEAVEQAISLR